MPRETKPLLPAPQEQDPAQRRFERTDAAAETLAETMECSHRQLLTARILLFDSQTKAEERIAKLDEARAETRGKLIVLIHMWDDWMTNPAGNSGKPAPRSAARRLRAEWCRSSQSPGQPCASPESVRTR